jgi:predicted GIY-YIG superfamily endonuclease
VKSTKFDHPLNLIYYEAYPSYGLAKKREYELKNSNQKKEFLYKRLGIK